MSDGVSDPDLARRLDELSRELDLLRRRVAALEGAAATVPPHAVSPQAAATPVEATAAAVEPAASLEEVEEAGASAVALVGRLLMVLGGAYLLRAMSEGGVVPPQAGVLAGLAYATLWLWRCDRAAAAGQRLNGVFHALGFAMTAFPLLFEVTARFGILPVLVGAPGVVVFFGLGIAVALRRDLMELAWIAVLFATAVETGLLFATRDLVPVTLSLLAMAAAIEVLSVRDRWTGLRWPLAAGVNLGVFAVAFVSTRSGTSQGPVLTAAQAVAVELLLPGVYHTSVAARTLMRGRRVSIFAIVQCTAALLLGLGGASWTAYAAGVAPTALGAFGLVIGAVWYVVALAYAEPDPSRRRNFYFYATLAIVLVFYGTAVLLPATPRVVVWLVLAVLATTTGLRFDRATLVLQAAAYLAGAAGVSGLLGASADSLVAAAAAPWRAITGPGLLSVAVALVCYLMLSRRRDSSARSALARLPVGVLAALGALGIGARLLAQPIGGGGPGADPGLVAAERTALLAAAALGLALAGRRFDLRELSWLVTPLLLCGAAKLVVEDLRVGRPATLFLSLVFYGGALILAPRLRRRPRPRGQS